MSKTYTLTCQKPASHYAPTPHEMVWVDNPETPEQHGWHHAEFATPTAMPARRVQAILANLYNSECEFRVSSYPIPHFDFGSVVGHDDLSRKLGLMNFIDLQLKPILRGGCLPVTLVGLPERFDCDRLAHQIGVFYNRRYILKSFEGGTAIFVPKLSKQNLGIV
jgi:hypothetical protein